MKPQTITILCTSGRVELLRRALALTAGELPPGVTVKIEVDDALAGCAVDEDGVVLASAKDYARSLPAFPEAAAAPRKDWYRQFDKPKRAPRRL